MDLIKDAYFGKSFMMLGDELPKCLGCAYCRANDGKGLHFHTLPTDINPVFNNIPVAVNCFYGDPMLQLGNTHAILDKLLEARHCGPKLIITKGDVSKFRGYSWATGVNVGVSTFGIYRGGKLDGGSIERFVDNLHYLEEKGTPFHIEFRPIINGVNDSDESIEFVMSKAQEFGVPVAYSGLQVSDALAERLKEKGIEFLPYEGKEFGLKKFISKEVEEKIRKSASCRGVAVFKKTSCLVSWMNKRFDYNAHYYRPNEVGCANCPNMFNCNDWKDSQDSHFLYRELDLHGIIPFDYKYEYAVNHVCSMFENGLCRFPSHDCTHISGRLLRIDEPITTTDVRLIKWLTGFTVKANFVELPYISEKWRKL